MESIRERYLARRCDVEYGVAIEVVRHWYGSAWALFAVIVGMRCENDYMAE